MAILILFGHEDSEDWLSHLRHHLPDQDFRIWPDVGAVEEIRYAVLGKTDPAPLNDLPNLRAMLSIRAGVDGLVDNPALPAAAPLVRMVDESLTLGMTEFVVLQVLRFHRRLPEYEAFDAEVRWNPLPQKLAHERTVGIMGAGVLGADAARVLGALQFDLAGWTRSPREIPGVTMFSGAEGLDAFLARSEILVNLLPLTPATRGILNARTLGTLPRGAVVINAARGEHVVDADLLALLDDGHLASAALDAFRDEPLPAESPFWSHPKVHVTPHVASETHARTCAIRIAENIRRMEDGLDPHDIVDRERGY